MPQRINIAAMRIAQCATVALSLLMLASQQTTSMTQVAGQTAAVIDAAVQTQLRCSAPSFGAKLAWVKIQSGPSPWDRHSGSAIDVQHRRIVTASTCSAATPEYEGGCRTVLDLDSGATIHNYQQPNQGLAKGPSEAQSVSLTQFNPLLPTQPQRAVWTSTVEGLVNIQLLTRVASATPPAAGTNPYTVSYEYKEANQDAYTQFRDTAIDSVSNLACVAGVSSGTPTIFGQTNPYPVGDEFMIVLCLDAATGAQRAAKIISTPNDDAVNALTLYRSAAQQAKNEASPSDSICIAGHTQGRIVTPVSPDTTTPELVDLYISCLSLWPPGAPALTPVFEKNFPSTTKGQADALAIGVNSATGRLYVAGKFDGLFFNRQAGGAKGTQDATDLFLMSLDVTTGAQQWVVQKSSPLPDGVSSGEAVVVDQRTGLIYVSAVIDSAAVLLCYEPSAGALLYSYKIAGEDLENAYDLSMFTGSAVAGQPVPNLMQTPAIQNGQNSFAIVGETSSSNLGGNGVTLNPDTTSESFVARLNEFCDYCSGTGAAAVCKNGATCSNGPLQNDFTCTCAAGWSGKVCSVAGSQGGPALTPGASSPPDGTTSQTSPTGTQAAPAAPATPGGSQAGAQAGANTNAVTNSNAAVSNSNTGDSASKSSSMPMIIGAIVGATVVIVLLVAACIYIRRRLAARSANNQYPLYQASGAAASPFDLEQQRGAMTPVHQLQRRTSMAIKQQQAMVISSPTLNSVRRQPSSGHPYAMPFPLGVSTAPHILGTSHTV